MTTSGGIRQPGTEATIVLDKYLDALTAGDLDAIADSFAEDATWSIHGTLPLSGTRHTVPRRTDPEDEHGATAVSGAALDGC